MRHARQKAELPGGRQASSLLVALIVMLVLTLALVGIFVLSQGGRRQVDRLRDTASFSAAADGVFLRALAELRSTDWAKRAYVDAPETSQRFGEFDVLLRLEDHMDGSDPRPGETFLFAALKRGDRQRGHALWVQFRDGTTVRPTALRVLRSLATMENLRDPAARQRVRDVMLADHASWLEGRAKALPVAREGEAGAAQVPVDLLAALEGARGLSNQEKTYLEKRDEGMKLFAEGQWEDAYDAFCQALDRVASYGDRHALETQPGLHLARARCQLARADALPAGSGRDALLDEAFAYSQKVVDDFEGHCLAPVAARLAVRCASRRRKTDPATFDQAMARLTTLASSRGDDRVFDEDVSVAEFARFVEATWKPAMVVVARLSGNAIGMGADLIRVDLEPPYGRRRLNPSIMKDCLNLYWYPDGSRFMALVVQGELEGIPEAPIPILFHRDGTVLSKGDDCGEPWSWFVSPSGHQVVSYQMGEAVLRVYGPDLREVLGNYPLSGSFYNPRPHEIELAFSPGEDAVFYTDLQAVNQARILKVTGGIGGTSTPFTPLSEYAMNPMVDGAGKLYYLTVPTAVDTPRATLKRMAVTGGPSQSLFTVDTPGGEVLGNGHDCKGWINPDGTRMVVAFSGMNRGGASGCHLVKLDDPNPGPIPMDCSWPLDPCWGPDGKFYSDEDYEATSHSVLVSDGETGRSSVFLSPWFHVEQGAQVHLFGPAVSP